MTHHYSITPRISETNLGGHIGAVVIPVWFEEARFAFINEILQGAGFRHFLVRYEIDFKKEIFSIFGNRGDRLDNRFVNTPPES